MRVTNLFRGVLVMCVGSAPRTSVKSSMLSASEGWLNLRLVRYLEARASEPNVRYARWGGTGSGGESTTDEVRLREVCIDPRRVVPRGVSERAECSVREVGRDRVRRGKYNRLCWKVRLREAYIDPRRRGGATQRHANQGYIACEAILTKNQPPPTWRSSPHEHTTILRVWGGGTD